MKKYLLKDYFVYFRRKIFKLRQIPLLLVFVSFFFVVNSMQMIFHIGNNIYRSFVWSQELQEVYQESIELQNDINILKDMQNQLLQDGYLEQISRCLGYVGIDEEVIVNNNAEPSFENCSRP